jgi:hypothetical protein
MLVFFVYVSLVAFSYCSLFHVGFVPRGHFSLHSIVYDIQVTYKQAADISFSHVYFRMINPANVVKIFADRSSNVLSSIVSNNATATTTITNREDDELINDVEFKDTAEETWDPNWNDEDEDEERALCR